jgi:hypothetical protein
MSSHLRAWTIGITAVVLGIGVLSSRSSNAADGKALADGVLKIADAFEKKDMAGAKKQSEAIAKDTSMEDLMHLFSLRTKKGLGVGSKPAVVSPDGIERKLTDLAKKELDAKQLGDEAQAIKEMGYSMAALASVCVAKPPEKDDGKKKKKDWVAWSADLQRQSLDLAAAANDKKAAEVFKAARAADATCTKCHDVFRE